VKQTGKTIKYGINTDTVIDNINSSTKKKITNVAGDKIDISNNSAVMNINSKLTAGFKVKAGDTEETVALDNENPEKVEFKAVSENNSFTVGITKDDTTHTKTITYKLSDNLTFGTAGENGKDGTIGVNGKDGSSVTINGKDGSIGLNGTNGQNGLSIRGEKGTEGKPGVDGTTTIKRIVITDPDGKNPHSVATLDDGLKFAGNVGNFYSKLNETVEIVGGEKNVEQLTDENIGVVAEKEKDKNGKLDIKLAKNLRKLESAEFTKTVQNGDKDETTSTVINDLGTTVTDKDGNTNQTTAGGTVIQNKDGKEKVEIKKDGLTIGNNTDSTKNISLTKDGLNMAEQEIKNVKESTTTTSAATVGQINKAKEALKTEIDKKADKDTVTADLANKANKNASNIGEA
ncbi:hypothetical protein C3L57_07625, partial [Veillonellaceae bacterium M2-8]|nr:hypothetical protein [Veillonellaceae bacterium M2-8]